MSDEICWLVTLFYSKNNTILNCALKINKSLLSEDIIEYPMKPENRKIIKEMLPEHVKSFGPIVEIVPLWDIFVYPDASQKQ